MLLSAIIYLFFFISFDLQSAERTTGISNGKSAYFNNAYHIGSGDQASSDIHYCLPGNAPDVKTEEHVYEIISDPRSYTNQAAVESEMNSKDVASKST